jgi:hypothetical protein
MSLRQAFQKTLSANDVGSTKAHQAGIHIPKTEKALLDFLPPLDPKQRNPDAWIECVDEDGEIHRFRYVYYNNKLHDEGGTRNEYRITHMTGYLRHIGAIPGDVIEISKAAIDDHYNVRILQSVTASKPDANPAVGPIKLKGWNRVH